MQERRIFERIEASMKIRYEVIEKSPALKKAISKDISGGGIKLALEESLNPGTNLKLDIEIPGEKNKITTAYGKVAWNKKVEISGPRPTVYYETGIQFTKVDPLTVGKIFKYFSEKNK